MRFWVLVLAVLLLPLRAWTGDAMALQMATQALAAGTSGPARQLVPATHQGHVLRAGRSGDGASVAMSTIHLHDAGAGTHHAPAGHEGHEGHEGHADHVRHVRHVGHVGHMGDARDARDAHDANDERAIHPAGAGSNAGVTVDAIGLNRTEAATQAHIEVDTDTAIGIGTDAAPITDATPCASTCGDCQLCHGLLAELDIAPLPFMPLPQHSLSRMASSFSSLAPAPSLKPPIA